MQQLLDFLNSKVIVQEISNGFYGPSTNEFQGWKEFDISDLVKLKMFADTAIIEKRKRKE